MSNSASTGFLQHALLVADDDVRRAQLHQALQPVVAVDHAAIEIVEIRGREAAAVERHQRAQLGRDDRHDVEDHPFGAIARIDEALDDLEPLDDLLGLELGLGDRELLEQILALALEVEVDEHLLDRFRADPGGEGVLAIFVLRGEDLVLGEQLIFLERGQARLDHDIGLEIEDALELLELHVEQQADAARQRLQEPDVRDGRGELDMAHPLAADLRDGDLDAALLADDALILHPLVLAAQALVILDRTEDARAEQAVALGLERAVVDGFGFLDLAERPGADALRGGDPDLDLVERLRLRERIGEIGHLVHKIPSLKPSPAVREREGPRQSQGG